MSPTLKSPSPETLARQEAPLTARQKDIITLIATISYLFNLSLRDAKAVVDGLEAQSATHTKDTLSEAPVAP